METQVYAVNKQNSLWHRISEIKKIIYDNGSERILFANGEIVLSVNHGYLEAYSINYASREKNTYQISKKLIDGYHPSAALSNARNSIINEIIKRTVGTRYSLLEKEIGKIAQKMKGDSFRRPEISNVEAYLKSQGIDLQRVSSFS